MAVLYSIRDWNTHFEVSQTRKVENLRWVPVPVRHDGLSFRRVMSLDDGLAIFGAWNLLLQIAGKCKVRGVLQTDSGRPMTAADVAIITGAPESGISHAMQVLASEDVGWLVESDSTQLESDSNEVRYNIGQDRTGYNNIQQRESVVVSGSVEPDEDEPLSEGWLEVCTLLRSEGMEFPVEACLSARANGCHCGEARFVANHWIEHKPAWGIGVLFNKIKSLRPDAKVSWPAKSAEYEKARKLRESEAKAQAQMANRSSKAAEKDNAIREKREVEAKFGPILDAMSKEKLREFVQLRLPQFANSALDFPIQPGLIRSAVLSELRRQPTTTKEMGRTSA